MHHLIGLWIPGNERSRFVTVYLGTGIGNIKLICIIEDILALVCSKFSQFKIYNSSIWAILAVTFFVMSLSLKLIYAN